MNKLKIVGSCILMFCVLTSCQKNKDGEYFNGEIRQIDDSRKIVKNITSVNVPLYGGSYGDMVVYDSLMIFWNLKLPDHFFNIFNIDTGEEIGSFFSKGRGPGESVSAPPIFQLFKKNGNLMTLINTANENSLFLWNISKSLEQGITVFDTIFSYNSSNKNRSSRYFHIFHQSENILLAGINSIALNDKKVTTPSYEKRTIYTDELLAEYPLYKISEFENKKTDLALFDYFYSYDVIKPDGSKIVQAMSNLPQINIIDTETGAIVGYRIKNGPGFSLFETNMKPLNKYYASIQVDDKYIYATYWGKERWESGNLAPNINTIHVYDWEGNQVYEIVTDRIFFRLSLDTVRNRLYTWDLETGDAAYLDLNELN